MNVTVTDKGNSVYVTLSRRNLASLLAKLDGIPEGSRCELLRVTVDGVFLSVKAEEDPKHYGDRKPGEIHRETEAALRKWYLAD